MFKEIFDKEVKIDFKKLIENFEMDFDDKTILLKHQEIVEKYFCDDVESMNVFSKELRGIMVYFNMGAGKTLTSLHAAVLYCFKYGKKKIEIFLKKSLLNNWIGQMKLYISLMRKEGHSISIKEKENDNESWTLVYENYRIYITYFQYDPAFDLETKINTVSFGKGHKIFNNSAIIVEECHNIFSSITSTKIYTNDLSNSMIVYNILRGFYGSKVMLLSGTPIFKNNYEAEFIVQVCNPKIDVKLFVENLDYEELFKDLEGIVMYSPGSIEKMPKILDAIYEYSELNEKERMFYKKEEKGNIEHKMEVETSKLVSITCCENKIQELVKYIKECNTDKHIIYTHYNNVNRDRICNALEENEIKFVEVHGELEEDDRQKMEYLFNNSADISVAILSKVSAEGISFTSVRHVHIMEPCENFGLLMEIVHRAARTNSHNNIAVELRTVEPIIYIANDSIDETIKKTSKKKYGMIYKTIEIMKESDLIYKKMYSN